MYVCLCVCVCIYTGTHTYIHRHTYTQICMFVCVPVCAIVSCCTSIKRCSQYLNSILHQLRMHICVLIKIDLLVSFWFCTDTHRHIHTHRYTQIYTHNTHTNTHTHTLYHTGKTLCKYGPVFAPYLHNWTIYGINTVQKRVCIYIAFFLCQLSNP